jgi:hypothetical protein
MGLVQFSLASPHSLAAIKIPSACPYLENKFWIVRLELECIYSYGAMLDLVRDDL